MLLSIIIDEATQWRRGSNILVICEFSNKAEKPLSFWFWQYTLQKSSSPPLPERRPSNYNKTYTKNKSESKINYIWVDHF